jgi:UDP-N-acetylmuramoylalanine--D-glutamate ligase
MRAHARAIPDLNYREFFEGKKITVMGLGILGRGVGDAEFLAEIGVDLTITDLKKPEELKESLDRLKQWPNIKYTLGEHKKEDFENCDMIIKAAGVPLRSPYLHHAAKNDVPVYMSTALFAKFCKAYLIGVTGTRGKSTTTQMIHDGLAAAGKKVHIGGNIKGKSTLAMLPFVRVHDYVVLELDSWQLQGFRDLKLSPHIAVFTNFMPDHMNYYNDNMSYYFHDKAGIYMNQEFSDYLVAGSTIVGKINKKKPKSKVIEPQPLPRHWHLNVPGEHNRANAALAAEVLRLCSVPESTIRNTVESFLGLEGRLNLVCESNGVRIYNDSNATTPEATEAALDSFPAGTILLIAGGADKNLDIMKLCEKMQDRCRAIAFLAGTGTKRLSEQLPDVPVFNNLEEAFAHLMRQAEEGDNLVLSPAFASFGMFKNEYDRGAQFEALVKKRETY